jgi:hypothetical protein
MRVLALLFPAFTAVTVVMCLQGFERTTGLVRMVMGVFCTLPVLMLIISILRLAVIFSRRISVLPDRLLHRQLFKHHDVPFQSMTCIEAREGADGEVDTIRIRWSGEPFYIDGYGLSGFDTFLAELRAAAPGVKVRIVEGFEPVS